MPLAIIWCISPLVLIPLAVWAISKKNKLDEFIKQLMFQGRISQQEYMTLKTQQQMQQQMQYMQRMNYAQQQYQQMQSAANMQNAQNVQDQMNGSFNAVAQDSGAVQNSNTDVSQPAFTQQTQSFGYYQNQSIPVKAKRKPNTAVAMLIIGVSFIILAAIVFSTAAWNNMTDWQKTGIIGAGSVLFLGASTFAHRKLRLENTGLAFYLLGGTFAAITFITAGFFGLMGEWLSIDGSGRFMLIALFMAILSGFSFSAVKIYRNIFAVHSALYTGMVTVMFAALQIFDSGEAWSLALNILSAAVLYLYFRKRDSFGKSYETAAKTFAVVLWCVYALTAVPFLLVSFEESWTVFGYLIFALWTAQLTFYGITLNNEVIKSIQSVAVSVLALEVCVSLNAKELINDTNSVILFSGLIFVLAVIYSFVKKIRTTVSDFVFPIVILISSAVFTSNTYSDIGYLVAIFVMLSAICFFNGFRGKTAGDKKSVTADIFRILMPVFTLMSVYFISKYASYRSYNVEANHDSFEKAKVMCLGLFAAAGFAAFLVFRYSKKLYTKFADIIIPVIIFLCGAAFPRGAVSGRCFGEAGIYLLSAFAMLIIAFDVRSKTISEAAKHAVILPLIHIAFSCSAGFELMINSDSAADAGEIICAAMLLALGVWLLSFRKLRTAVSDFAVPAALIIKALVSNSELLLAAAVYLFSAAALLMVSASDGKRKTVSQICSIAAPLIMLPASILLSEYFEDAFAFDSGSGMMIFTTLAVFAAAFFTVSGQKIMQYSFEVLAGILGTASLISCAESGILMLVIASAVMAGLYVVSAKQKCNIFGIIPLIGIFAAMYLMADFLYVGSKGNFVTLFCLIYFALMLLLSRRFFRESFGYSKLSGKTGFDLAGAALILSPLVTIGMMDSGKYSKYYAFTAAAEIGIFFFNLCRTNNKKDLNRTFLSVGSAFFALAVYIQPFFEIKNKVISHKVDLIPLIALGFAFRYIWKENKKFASDLGFGVHAAAYGLLIIDALFNQSLFNTFTVLAVSLVILLVSFFARELRWFTVSAAGLVGLTLYITRDYLAEIDWWIYLLIVGILLITTAAVNEYLKSRGENLMTKTEGMRSRWKK